MNFQKQRKNIFKKHKNIKEIFKFGNNHFGFNISNMSINNFITLK